LGRSGHELFQVAKLVLVATVQSIPHRTHYFEHVLKDSHMALISVAERNHMFCTLTPGNWARNILQCLF